MTPQGKLFFVCLRKVDASSSDHTNTSTGISSNTLRAGDAPRLHRRLDGATPPCCTGSLQGFGTRGQRPTRRGLGGSRLGGAWSPADGDGLGGATFAWAPKSSWSSAVGCALGIGGVEDGESLGGQWATLGLVDPAAPAPRNRSIEQGQQWHRKNKQLVL